MDFLTKCVKYNKVDEETYMRDAENPVRVIINAAEVCSMMEFDDVVFIYMKNGDNYESVEKWETIVKKYKNAKSMIQIGN